MALIKVSKSTLLTLAENLMVAAKRIRKAADLMTEKQPELLCEIGTRVKWGKGFRKFGTRIVEEQVEQLQLLQEGVDLDQQMERRQPGKGKRPPIPAKKSKKKGT